jgi:hypothetical protein
MLETWSYTMRGECGMRICENMVLRGIIGSNRKEVTGDQKKRIVKTFMISTAQQMSLGLINEEV